MENTPETSNPPEETATPAKRGKRAFVYIRALWIVAMAPVVFAVIVAAMLIGQDVSAPSWLNKRIQERAATALNGAEIQYEGLDLNIGADLHPRVRMNNVSLIDAEGVQIAQIGALTGQLSPRGVVFERRALLQDVSLSGLKVDLERGEDGLLKVAFDNSAQSTTLTPEPEVIFAQIERIFEAPALEALEKISISDVSFELADAASGQTWLARSDRVLLDVSGEDRVLSSTIAVQDAADVGVLKFAVTYRGSKSTAASEFAIETKEVNGSDLANVFPALQSLNAMQAPVRLRAFSGIDNEGVAKPISVEIDVGAGRFEPGAQTPPIAITSASLVIQQDPKDPMLFQSGFDLVTDRVELKGSAQLFRSEDEMWIAQVQAQDISVNVPEVYNEPLSFHEAYWDMRVGQGAKQIDIGAFTLRDQELLYTGHARAAKRLEGWAVTVEAESPYADVTDILRLWPESAAKGARRWFEASIKKATLTDLTAAVNLAPDGTLNVAAGYEFDSTEIRLLKTMPVVEEAAGYGSFANNAFGVFLSNGYMSAAEGGRIDLTGSRLEVADMITPRSLLDIYLTGEGSITSALSILNQPPLRMMDRASRPVALADGRARFDGVITFPRINPVPPDRISYDFEADLTRLSSTNLVPDRTLRSSGLSLKADNEGFEISGPGQLDGVPFTGTYEHVFGRPEKQVTAQVEISPATLNALDIALPQGTVGGIGRGDLAMTIEEGKPPAFSLTSNLQGITVAVPPIGWSKPRDTRGELRIAGTMGDRPEITDLRISGGGLEARGRVSLNAGGGLDTARFSQLQIGNWFNAPITLKGRGAGRPVGVEIGGGVLDMRRARFGPRQGESGPVDIALDRLQVSQGIVLNNFRGSFAGAGGFNGSFRANLNGGPEVQGTVVPQNGRSAIRLQSADAGGLARAVGFLKGGSGGSLDLVLSPAGGEGTFDGQLTVRQFRVRDAPAMAALLDAISVVGLLQQLDGQGLSFEEVDARFRLTPSQVVVTQSSAIGPGLGISLDGVYSLASKQLDFQGVVSPFYLLNGIGSFLTRKGEGLIGFNFTVRGDTSAPQVGVNPLSALTPGMFREIFRRPPPDISQ